MVNINIEINDELHKRLKIRSVLKNITLKEYIITELQEGLVVLKKKK
ncbi:MAG: hypothetical protein QXG00_01365 [Candidatus Woesearchaeota archaeon]